MTRLALDAPVLLDLVRADRPLGGDVSLVGPAALKSHLAVAMLQADALVTEDPVLVAAADGRVRIAAPAELHA